MAQEQVQKPRARREETAPGEIPAVSAEEQARRDKVQQELDELIDEIDITLEEAEQFVAGYRQKAGE